MKRITVLLSALCIIYSALECSAASAPMGDYCIMPPFIAQVVPPLVMFETGRDHKFFYQAYNDAIDLDDDGQIDSKYKHSIQYYGYFDPFKCYTHSGGATGGSGNTDQFTPVSTTTDKFCSSGQWSGNVLNWLTMSRMDVLRRVLYGGSRKTDSGTATSLQRSFIPQDAHSWGKELTGRLCFDNGTSTYSYTCSTSSDCKSGDVCVDKSAELIGIAASDAPSVCAAGVTAPTYSTANKILLARYQAKDQSNNPRTGLCGDYSYTYDPATNQSTERDDIYLSYFNWNTTTDGPINDSLNLLRYDFITGFDFKDATVNKYDADPLKDHVDNFNFFAAAEFTVANADKGDWQFLLDGDDGVELLIDGVVKSIYPGCHPACFQAASSATYPPKDPATFACTTGSTPPTVATVNLTSGVHRLLVRHRDSTGQDGIRLWYRKTTSNATSWSVFADDASHSLTLKAPAITAANECSIKTTNFISDGTPRTGTAKQHVFCNTSLAANGSPLLRLAKNSPNHMWDWAGRERPVCGANFKVSGSDVAANPIDYTVQVEVCKTGLLEDNCKGYPIGSATPTSFKPVGLLQKYGDGDNTKVCSKTMSKTCTNDAGCTLATEGLCMYKTNMYFGMAGTSYAKNKSGGVIRKNFGSMLDEVNANQGYVETAENISGNIIHTFDKMSVVDFDFTGTNTPSYLANCPFSAGAYGVFTEGTQCRMWGNPIGEMMYESLRYIAGKGTSTTAFDYTTPADAGLSLSHPTWGKFGTGSATYKPYDVFPTCARPFLLVLSDINTSYDDDQLPGTSFGTYADENTPLPKLNMNVTTLANTISATEAIDNAAHNKQYFIGETTSLIDYYCSAKTVTSLSLIRGICPEEPTKKGSFYAAAVAYYGKNGFKTNTLLPEVNTFVIALSSPIADLKFKAGTSYFTIVPVGKSVHGGWTSNIHCLDRCTTSHIDASKGLILSGCTAGAINPTTEAGGAYCPSNQIVNTYVKNIKYDASSNVIYAKYSISYEDVEMGSDFEMDALVDYEICTAASKDMAGTSCTEVLGSDQIEVKLNSISSAGGVDQAMGFVISGSTADGIYLPVRDTDSSTLNTGITIGGNVIKLPTQSQHIFTPSTTGAASFLKSPLWYAAKWGGFSDKNGNNIPDLKSEWAANCTETDITKCDPDNYFLVVNPLNLEHQLDKALNDIMRRVSSGTAASILNNSEGSGATLLQAIFYPKKAYDNETELSWSGELMNLWYYVDPFFALSTIREDTDYVSGNHVMDISRDKRAQFYFDDTESQTRIRRYNFDGTTEQADFNPDVTGGLKTMWTAGKLLWRRNISAGSDPRKIYTTVNSSSFIDFSTTNAATLSTRMNADGVDAAAQTAFATKVIDYVNGTDVCLDGSSPCTNKSRNRTVDIKVSDATTESHVWKLGDIISSTPKIQGGQPLHFHDSPPPLGYNDTTYKDFYLGDNYKNRGMVYVGANDGMLHAFKLGKMEVRTLGTQKATLSGTSLGREEWAYIPKQALPYLKYLTLPEYDNNHLYLVDGTNALFDVSTKTTDATRLTNGDYWNETRTAATWKTVLLGGMGLGGAAKTNVNACTDKTAAGTCVKTPFDAANTYGLTHGFSSYFAIDISDQDFNQNASNLLREQPTLLWEFSDPSLGYSTSGPAIIRLKPNPHALNDPSNGRWFAVYASGPTGPIDAATKQFKGKSDQNLKLFIVDIQKGPVVDTDPKKRGLWIIDTGISEAFAGSISNNAVVDAEMTDGNGPNIRQDDVVYVGYTRKCVTGDTGCTVGEWSSGGMLRLVIPESADPDIMWTNSTDATAWKTSKVIDGIGPVTTTVAKLMSKNNLYLFFGTGRYYFPQDDMSTTHRLLMVKEKCYPNVDKNGQYLAADMTPSCPSSDATHNAVATLALSDLTPKTTPSSTAVTNGWYIDLDAGERVVTDTVATVNGAVFYTSYKPTADVCGFGGKSYLWGVQYDNGNTLPAAAQKGKILIQLSTGSFAEMDLATALTEKGGRRTAETSDLSFGKASADPGLFMTSAGMNPVKRILHIQERYK